MQAASTGSLTIAAVAERLRVDSDTVRHWVKSGRLRAVNVSRSDGRLPRWRVLLEDLETFIRSRANVKPDAAKTQSRARVSRPRGFIEYF